MNILIIDGNEKKVSDKYIEVSMSTQYDLYKKVLKDLLNIEFNIEIIHPACIENYLSKGLNLDDFQGVIWTGSSLNIYNLSSPIQRQIELAKELLNKKNKIFGSCWGLQVLITASGGNVRKNPKGLEAVIANDIIINNNGINHPMYLNKPKKFDSFCWHYDEVDKLPDNAKVLSSNNMSSIQSVAFSHGDSEVWAVQYHPEFNPKWISGLMQQRKLVLLEEGIYESSDKYNDLSIYLSDIKKFNYLKFDLSISNTLINKDVHTIELSNWLKNLMNDNELKN